MLKTKAKLRKGKRQGDNAQSTAYGYIKDRILEGALPGGAPINPAETGKILGISRMPVREALLQLESEGLVRFGQNGRPIVTALTPTEIMELFEIRIALEQLAISRAVGRMTEKTLQELASQLTRMEKAKEDPQTWLALHDEFHDLIYSASAMPKLMEEIRRLREWIRPYILMYMRVFGQPEIKGHEHSALLQVLRRRDPDAAQSAIGMHIRTGASSLVYFLLNDQSPVPRFVDA